MVLAEYMEEKRGSGVVFEHLIAVNVRVIVKVSEFDSFLGYQSRRMLRMATRSVRRGCTVV